MPDQQENHPKADLPDPPPLSSVFVKLLLGIFVSVVVGLAPFLGTLGVPLFSALIDLYPVIPPMRDQSITLGAFLMGVITAGVEFYGLGRLRDQQLTRWFGRTLIVVLIMITVMLGLSTFLVSNVWVGSGNTSYTVLEGFVRISNCPCDGRTLNRCLNDPAAGLVLEEIAVPCYGERQLDLAQFVLGFGYLVLIGSAAVLVGLITLRTVRQNTTQDG